MALKASEIGRIEFRPAPTAGQGLALDARGRLPQELVAWSLIEHKKLDAATDPVTFLNIPSSFKHLKMFMTVLNDTGASAVALTFNNDSSAVYYGQYVQHNVATSSPAENIGGTSVRVGSFAAAANRPSNIELTVFNYADDGTFDTTFQAQCFRSDGDSTGNQFVEVLGGAYNITDRVTRIDLAAPTGSFAASSEFTLYGLNV